MRYRPIGSTGSAVSSLCLSLGPEQFKFGTNGLKDLIFSALEAGINAYHIDWPDPQLLQAAGEALAHVERRLIWVSLTLGQDQASGVKDFSPGGLTRTVEMSLHNSGLGWFDVAVLDQPAEHELPLSSLNALKVLRNNNQVRFLGIRGHDPVMDAYVSTGAFNVLYTPFSIQAEWLIRARMRAAQKRDMAIFIHGYDVLPQPAAQTRIEAPKKGLLGLVGRRPAPVPPPEPEGPFAFFHSIAGWTAQELCLGFALTEPSVSSAMIAPTRADQIEAIAAVPERDLPSGLSAQIEMARVV